MVKAHGQSPTRSYHTLEVEITKQKKPKKIITKVTLPPPGKDSAWIQSFENSLNEVIPYKNKAKAGKYIVAIKFLIEKDGSIADTICIVDPGFEMCRQVRSVFVKQSFKKWGPSAGN